MKAYDFTPPQPPRFTNIHSVTQNAKECYCWIFHRPSLRWWTPDEFYDEFHERDFMSIQMLNFLEDVSIRDPRSGISAAFSQLTKMEENHKVEKKS